MNRPWFERASILGLLVVSWAIRAYHVGEEMITSDEAFSWRVATRPIGLMVREVGLDTHPLLHFLLLRLTLDWWGSSPTALRAVSVAAGVATVWFVYLLCVQAASPGRPREGAGRSTAHWSAFVAAAYIAIHPLHVEFSRTARMYALGAMLSGLSGWLLLRALQEPPPVRGRWLGYAVAASLLMHTHNYGIIAVCAQLTAAVTAILFSRGGSARLWDLVWPYTLICALYAPWISTMLAQSRRVHKGFWINPLSWKTVSESLASFVYGVRNDPTADVLIAVTVASTMAWLTARRPDVNAWGLALQAVMPWAVTFAVSTIGGRPILQDRYLLFASVPFAAWFGVALHRAPGVFTRVFLAANLLAPEALALVHKARGVPAAPPPIYGAMTLLRAESSPGDEFFVRGYISDLNILRYYAGQIGWDTIRIRYSGDELELGETGHVNHISSLEPEDMANRDGMNKTEPGRVWIFNGTGTMPEETWRCVGTKTFFKMRSFPQGLQVSTYERIKNNSK